MEETIEFIRGTIQDIVDRSRLGAFRSEDQIQGFFEGRARYVFPKGLKYIAECPTKVKYVREEGYLRQSEVGKRGRIDAVIRSISGDIAGIEIQYPRGQGILNRDLFISHIGNDVRKLRDYEELRERYLLIFMYNNPPDDLSLRQLYLHEHSVHMALIRLVKKSDKKVSGPVAWIEAIPEGWVSHSELGEITVA